MGRSVALATIQAVVPAIAKARMIGVGMARSTSRELGSAWLVGVGVDAER
jgi:hypothetical protein